MIAGPGKRDDGAPTPVAAGDGRTADRRAALVLLAAVLFNPPVLRAFGAGDAVLGWPLLYVYIFAIWLAVIVAAALLLGRDGGEGA